MYDRHKFVGRRTQRGDESIFNPQDFPGKNCQRPALERLTRWYDARS